MHIIREAEIGGMLVGSDTELCVRNRHKVWHNKRVLQTDRSEDAVN